MRRSENLPKIEDCIKGRVYKIRCRNLSYGVWNGRDGFIGIRLKFHDRYLFTEYHYDTGAPFGTVWSAIDTGTDVPKHIRLVENLETIDYKTKRPMHFVKENEDGTGWWYFSDTNERGPKPGADPYSPMNKELFDFLDDIGKQLEDDDV
jgi:hypothetical protein